MDVESKDSVSRKSLESVETVEKPSFGTRVKNILLLKELFSKNEERPTPKDVYNFRTYGTAFMTSAAAIIIGYDSSFIGGVMALDSFKSEFGLDQMSPSHASYVISNIISSFHAACFFGALISYPFSHYYGRKVTLLIASFMMTLGSAIMLAASSSVGLGPIYAGRVLGGLAVGFSTNVTVIYLSEIGPPSIRGMLVSMYELCWRIGDLNGFWINYGVDSNIPPSRKQWLIPFAIQLIPSALFLIGSILMKESPRWLFSVGKDEKAMKNLLWFRRLPRDSEYIIYEVNQIKLNIDYQRTHVGLGLWDPFKQVFFKDRRILKRLFITGCIFVFQSFLGIQSINYYSPIFFRNLGVKGTNATLFSTGIFGLVKFVCTFIYILFIVENLGRTKALMISSSVCAICFWYIGTYLKLNDPSDPNYVADDGGRATIAMMYIWVASFIMAWSSAPFVIGSEVFDQNIRSFVQAINAAICWVPIFILSRYTANMVQAMGYGVYYFFASITVISIPFVFFLVPETKGIALEDMDKLFDRRIPAYKAHKIVFEARLRENRQIMNHELKDLEKKPEIETVEYA